MNVHVLIAAVCLLYLKTAFGQCGDGWFQRRNSCYHISHDKQEWFHASDICNIDGGYLVEVNDADEGHFLEYQVKLFNFPEAHGQVWMGATDNMIKGDWVWTHSNTMLSSRSYTHWSPVEPNNDGGNENCLSIMANGFWNDVDCDIQFHYICEKDAVYGVNIG